MSPVTVFLTVPIVFFRTLSNKDFIPLATNFFSQGISSDNDKESLTRSLKSYSILPAPQVHK